MNRTKSSKYSKSEVAASSHASGGAGHWRAGRRHLRRGRRRRHVEDRLEPLAAQLRAALLVLGALDGEARVIARALLHQRARARPRERVSPVQHR